MSLNPLNDISKVYLEQVAFQEAKVDAGKTDQEKRSIRTARQGYAGVKIPNSSLHTGDISRRAAHRERDELNKDAKDIRRGKLSGSQFQGETGKERIAAVKKAKGMKEALDPVGQEDADIDNDGDTDKSDKYLHKRRKAIGKAIKKDKMKESFSNWRQDLAEVMTDVEDNKKIDVKTNIKNKVKINPQLGEAVEEMGGTIIEMIEIEEIELIEKAESEQQQKLFGLALSVKRGQTSRSEVSDAVLKIVDSMSEKKIRDFAKTKHEGIPKKVEEELQPTTPQQLAAQRKLTLAQKELSMANQAALRMKKKETQQEEYVSEEDHDKMKDRHLERGGMGARSSTSPARQSQAKPQTDAERKASMEKQKETARRALEMVRQQTMSKYGKGSLM